MQHNSNDEHHSNSAATNGEQNGSSLQLTDEEFDRYSRQMIVPGMGKDGMTMSQGGTLPWAETNTQQLNFDL